MKRKIKLFVALLVVTMGSTQIARAAFPIQQEPVAATATTTAEPQQPVVTTTVTANAEAAQSITSEMTVAKKQSFFGKIWHKVQTKAAAVIHPVLYVVMSIFWLGWLAIGINDDFKGNDWWIALLLYFLFYIPGLIFSLIKMGKYY